MFGRGSPRINLMEVASRQSKSSPKHGGKRKRRSPKAKCSRANWNPGLEKGLVQILLDHDNDCYRAQNGWKTEAWNLMYQKFCDQFPHVGFSRDQIQDKEKELKREFNILKDARQQSGVHWDEKLCMIKAEPPIWDNIILSHPKASKFQRQSFPLYDDLYKLYIGKTAEGKHAFISVERKTAEDNVDDVRILQPAVEQLASDGGVGSLAFLSSYNHYEDEDDDVTILHASTSAREKGPTAESSSMEKRPAAESSSRDIRHADEREERAASGAKGGKAGEKRKFNGDVAEMIGKYLEIKTKQTQEDVAEQERARAKADATDFSIKNCNALLATMKELSGEERADAYDIFKDSQNREIFMTAAEPSSRLIWLRRKIRLINSST